MSEGNGFPYPTCVPVHFATRVQGLIVGMHPAAYSTLTCTATNDRKRFALHVLVDVSRGHSEHLYRLERQGGRFI